MITTCIKVALTGLQITSDVLIMLLLASCAKAETH